MTTKIETTTDQGGNKVNIRLGQIESMPGLEKRAQFLKERKQKQGRVFKWEKTADQQK